MIRVTNTRKISLLVRDVFLCIISEYYTNPEASDGIMRASRGATRQWSYTNLQNQNTTLANATQTKSAAEVTKLFVESTSYILRAVVGGTGGKGGKSTKA